MAKQENQAMGKDEQIGYHKGALSVLAKEREEFLKILQVVEQLMYAHVDALKKLGVNLQPESKTAAQGDSQEKKTRKKPIDEALK
ncbi:MAG: hypothetical protein V1659_04395 [Candidatus Woesearchaeota archaeon]